MANSLWASAGKIVLAAGKAVLCGHCPCGAVTCCPGVVIPDTVYLTVTDDGSGTLGNCPCVGGTFALGRNVPGVGTVWNTGHTLTCANSNTAVWGLRCTPPGVFGPSTRWNLFFSCDDGNFAGPYPVAQWDGHCDPFGNSGVGGVSILGDFGHNAFNCCADPSYPPGGASFNWTVGP